jgi:hypothetical protein
LYEIRIKIDYLEGGLCAALGTRKMNLAFGTGGDQGLGTGLDGFLHTLDLNGF